MHSFRYWTKTISVIPNLLVPLFKLTKMNIDSYEIIFKPNWKRQELYRLWRVLTSEDIMILKFGSNMVALPISIGLLKIVFSLFTMPNYPRKQIKNISVNLYIDHYLGELHKWSSKQPGFNKQFYSLALWCTMFLYYKKTTIILLNANKTFFSSNFMFNCFFFNFYSKTCDNLWTVINPCYAIQSFFNIGLTYNYLRWVNKFLFLINNYIFIKNKNKNY